VRVPLGGPGPVRRHRFGPDRGARRRGARSRARDRRGHADAVLVGPLAGDAETLARNLGIRFHTIPIDAIFQSHLDALAPALPGALGVAEENIQARVRGAVLMAFSNTEGSMLLSTGNKSELAVGYCTLYGDMCGGLARSATCRRRWSTTSRGT
jgi:hypothetical protein